MSAILFQEAGWLGFGLRIALGGVLVWIGAEALVRGSSRLALRSGMAPFLVGATIVAFGTSAPELVVSVVAHDAGSSGMSLGNVLGSNVCNIALVLGLIALLLTVRVRARTLRRELPLVLGAEVLFLGLAWDGAVGLADGIALLVAFLVIYSWLVLASRRGRSDAEESERAVAAIRTPLTWDSMLTVAGLVLLLVGAHVFVVGASGFALQMGMSETLVGATIVAVGTSLPELVTSVVAAVRGELDISLGNLLGSNLFNVLLVGGVLTTIGPVATGPEELYHCWWMLAVTAIVFPLSIYTKLAGAYRPPRVDRIGGILLLAIYVAYLVDTI